jgi:AraC-like DNA-binding protein
MKNYDLRDLENTQFTSFHELIHLSHERNGITGLPPEDYLIVNLLLEGEAIYQLDKKEFQVRSNTITITHPKQEHKLLLSKPNQQSTLIYSPEYLHQFIAALTQPHAKLLEQLDSDKGNNLEFKHIVLPQKWDTIELIRSVYELSNITDSDDSHMLEELFFHDALLSVLRNEYLLRCQEKAQRKNLTPGVKEELLNRVEKAIDYIKSAYTEDISLEQLATVSNLSKFHFTRIFKKITGKTPYQYLMQIRVTEAKNLLLHSNRSITEIAYEVGFNNPTSFYNFFIKEVGISPSRYRNQ